MTINIDIQDETNQLNEEQLSIVKELLSYAAKLENVKEPSEVSVTFVDDKTIQEINREYRNKDNATDVISFALNDEQSDIHFQDNILNLLGDIIISYDRTITQAKEYGHSINRELGFLVVHGFLHLLGYDHLNEKDEKVMFSKQEEILEAYGLQK